MSEKITRVVDGFELDVNMNYEVSRQTIYNALQRELEYWNESNEINSNSSETYSTELNIYIRGRIEAIEELMNWAKTVL